MVLRIKIMKTQETKWFNPQPYVLLFAMKFIAAAQVMK